MESINPAISGRINPRDTWKQQGNAANGGSL
jgi:hypothetical protein